MLKKVIITNYLGETAEYKIEGVQSDDASGLFITSVEGLGPVKASINMLDLATTDGQLYNSARLSGRNIVIKALFTDATSIEEARLLSYKYFPIKSKVNIKVVTDNRIGETDGYVESNEPDIFSEREGCQISILCENPYFDGGKIGYTFGDTIPLFKFQFGNESLDEPLIKLSEEAEVTDERRIIYDGDTDAGMEITVGAPTNDPLDTFSIKGIEIQSSDGKIKIDTSKMVSQVPNTSPTDLGSYMTSFFADETRSKFMEALPFDCELGWLLIYKNELHWIGNPNAGVCKRLKLNKSNNTIGKWESLPDIPTTSSITTLTNLNNVLYRYNHGGNNVFRYDDETNEWVYIVDAPSSFNGYSASKMAVSYGDYIHYFNTEYVNGEYRKSHYIFDGSHFTYVESLGSIFGSSDSFHDGKVIVYDGKIHIFANTNKHYIYDGQTWVTLDQTLPVSLSAIGGVVVYNNKLWILNVDKHRYSWKDENSIWTQGENLLRGVIHTSYWNRCEVFEGYIYIFGNMGAEGAYTEEANNIRLIENDRLVINTIKGKKGVTLYRDDNKYNVLNSLDKDSTWLQLHRGVNKFSYSAEEGADDMQITISTNKWYEGV